MLTNRIRANRSDYFTLRGWRYPFHQFQDGPQLGALYPESEEVRIWKLHGGQEVEIRYGDVKLIAAQVNYPLPAPVKAQERGSEPETKTVEVEKIVTRNDPATLERLAELEAKIASEQAARKVAEQRASDAEDFLGSLGTRTLGEFQEPGLSDEDRAFLADHVLASDESPDDLFSSNGSVNEKVRTGLVKRLIGMEAELRRSRMAGEGDAEKESEVKRLQGYLGRIGSRRA